MDSKNIKIKLFFVGIVLYLYIFKWIDIFGLNSHDDGDVSFVARLPIVWGVVIIFLLGFVFIGNGKGNKYSRRVFHTILFFIFILFALIELQLLRDVRFALLIMIVFVLLPLLLFPLYVKIKSRVIRLFGVSLFLVYIIFTYPIRDFIERFVYDDPCWTESLQRGSGPEPRGPRCLFPDKYLILDDKVCYQKIDQRNICRWHSVQGADPETFVDHGRGYGTDKNRGYQGHKQ